MRRVTDPSHPLRFFERTLQMDIKKTTLAGLIALLLTIIAVLSSVLVFTAVADNAPEAPEIDPMLLDNTLASYSFDMSRLSPVEGAIPPLKRNGKDCNPDQIYTDEDGAKIVFINIEGTAFDEVVFTGGSVDGGWMAWWFLTEMPTKGEPVSYAGNQTDRESTKRKNSDTDPIDIPEDAKILAIYYSDPGYVYCPTAITFYNSSPKRAAAPSLDPNLLDNNYASYSFDMSLLTPVEGIIPPVERNAEQLYTDEDGAKIVFINIEGTVFDEVVFTGGSVDGGWMAWWFLTEMPTKGKPVSYAGNQTDRESSTRKNSDTDPIEIPEDAKILAIYYSDPGYVYCPKAITFRNSDPNPITLRKPIADVRLSSESGLRFVSKIKTADLEAIAVEYSVGALIYPTDLLGKGMLTVDFSGAIHLTGATPTIEGEDTCFGFTVVDMQAQNYARSFTCVSYIEINGTYYYSGASSASLYETAINVYKANAASPYADIVRGFIDGVVVIKNGAQTLPYSGYEHALQATVSGNTLTISAKDGSSLSANDLKTVILDGVIFTGGWKVSGKNLTATLPTSLDATATDEDQLNWALDDDTDLSFSHPDPEWDKWDNGADIMTATNSLLYLTYELRNCYNNSTYYDACLTRILEQLRYLIDEDNNATPFFDLKANWPYCNLTGAIALCKDTPAIWNSLTKDERARYDLIMECFAYILTLGTDDDNDYETGPLLDGNFAKGWNPNYRLANVAPMLFIADYFGGADAVDALLLSFDYDSVIARMKAYGFERSYNAWTTEPASGKPTVKEIMMNGGKAYLADGSSAGSGVGVKTEYTYKGYRLDQPDKILRSLFEYNYSGGTVKSSIKKYSFIGDTVAYIDGNLKSPYEGQKGMMLEFNSDDGGGIRSSAEYCMHDFIMVVAILMVTEELDIYDPLDAENLDLFALVWVGNQDFMYKYEMGYMSYANGESEGVVKESTKKGYMLMKALWNDRYGDPTYTISFPYGS